MPVFSRFEYDIFLRLISICDLFTDSPTYLCGVSWDQFFMEPSDYYDAPIVKVLHFIRGVGLIKG
jgi:hypothetical protein